MIFVSVTSLIALFVTVIYCNYCNLVLSENIISEDAHHNDANKLLVKKVCAILGSNINYFSRKVKFLVKRIS